ncbi:TlpA disulfide reductase family protein [Nocardioides sp.]|uniref:TlpA family protein disulfide reductase n=1 Tax=Nocardioides sp. TaxID=35761 RepID=UPI002C01A49F|nr:TlpA disulfide reductase family protein [Nocardioides sp.]HXH80594.1 TlpA disulfide reductase family protein [Nocardioides sp.]
MSRLATLACAGVLLLTGCASDVEGDATGTEPAASAAESTSTAGADSTASEASVDVPEVLDFTTETVAGEPFDGADLAGRPTVFWFWAPWCPTCRAQISGVGELAATYGSEVNVVGIGALDEREAIEEFAAEVSPDVTLLADPEGAAWRHFGVTAQSTYLVLDESGTELESGYLDDAELVALVDDLVG